MSTLSIPRTPSATRLVSIRVAATAVAIITAGILAGCGDIGAPISEATANSIGQCTRDQVMLRGPAIDCVTDLQCPCGSFCDGAVQTCTFDCNIPPVGMAESCPNQLAMR